MQKCVVTRREMEQWLGSTNKEKEAKEGQDEFNLQYLKT